MENGGAQDASAIKSVLLEKARGIGSSAGVYLMKDDRGTILYVGKAKVLCNRLMSYFQPAEHENPRTRLLVSRISGFDVILTQSEDEALILECTLIKKHKPKFNIRLRDDKAYPYLRIASGTGFPCIEWVRRAPKDGARYFGPYPSASAAYEVRDFLTAAFKLRDCSDNVFRHRSRPCILHQMGKCSAPCTGLATADGYAGQIGRAIGVLEGKNTAFIANIRTDMEKAAAAENFELAARLRNLLGHIETVTAMQAADEAGSGRSRDAAVLVRKDGAAHAVVLQIRDGRMSAIRHFGLQNTDKDMPDEELMHGFLEQYYLSGKSAVTAAEVLVDIIPGGLEVLERSADLRFTRPSTSVDQRIMAVAKANALHAIEHSARFAAEKDGHGTIALEDTKKRLNLARFPRRIECYDISNLQGTDPVASRATFVDASPDKNLYRRYKIKTVTGQNDFAMLREVLARRFDPSNAEPLPDLLLVDGGKGQLAQAVAILETLGLQGIEAAAIAKSRVESDFKSSEVRASAERVYLPGRKNPVILLPHTACFKLLTHARDEAHRFAIGYQRLLRKSMKSIPHTF